MKHIIGISMGDPSGIGGEIVVKALGHEKVYNDCVPVVIGDKAAISDALRFTRSGLRLRTIQSPAQAQGVYGQIDLIDLGLLKSGAWHYKKVEALSGEAAFSYVTKGIELAMKNELQALVTGPINKESINLAGHHFAGHTEILAHYTGTESYAMMLTSPELRVVHVTTHVSMDRACQIIRTQPQRVQSAIRLAQEGLRLLGIERPRIAVAGLNAHCSENGLFGCEEEVSILPAIRACQADGMLVDGPVPPDTVFVKAIGGAYDAVVAMYHDQGHIPLKLCGFKLDRATNQYTSMAGVNVTIGLPIIRTSVDHGTAFGKAGEGRANEESLLDAIDTAVTMARHKFSQKQTH